jgi:G:T-mismatch repair DNA endonuclease (very short patch repair protein)
MTKNPNPNHPLTGKKQSPEHIAARIASRRENGTYVGLKGENNPMYGKPAWNKGKTGLQSHSPESKELMRLAKLGKKQTEEHKRNAVIARMKLAGEKGYYKKGSERSLNLSKALKGRIITEEWRKNMSKAWDYDKHVTPTSRRKQRESRLRQVFPTKDSKPERMMHIALALHGIKFEKHKAIIGQPDIFIEPNVCVFIDGDYFHANPLKYDSDFVLTKKPLLKAKDVWARDSYVTHELNQLGYHVIRIWASKIKEDANVCALNIINLIKERSYQRNRSI